METLLKPRPQCDGHVCYTTIHKWFLEVIEYLKGNLQWLNVWCNEKYLMFSRFSKGT
jgi:hypothetical protein